MQGLKFILPTRFSNAALDKLRDDPILPDSGALLFLDPAHPLNSWSGSVISGATVPNLAYAQAKALMPTGTESTLAGKITLGSSFTAAGVAERSGKGGIHFMPSQATPGDATATARVETGGGTSPLNQYLRNNPTHKFYTALWGKITRPGLALSAGVGNHLHSKSDGTTQIHGFYNRVAAGATEYPTDSRQLGHYGTGVAPTAAGVNFFQDQATQPTATNSASVEPLATGNVTGTDYGKTAGFILYGFYLEDLTVSGRDYAAVSALVKSKYDRDVVQPSGRYYADTYTTKP